MNIRFTDGPIAIGPGMLHSGSGGGPKGPKTIIGKIWEWIKKKLRKK